MVVAMTAPTMRNAARPANRWQASHRRQHDEGDDERADDEVAARPAPNEATRRVIGDPEDDEDRQRGRDRPPQAPVVEFLSIRNVLALKR